MIWKSITIMGRTININFIVTKHEIRNFAASCVTRYMSDETGGVSFLAISWSYWTALRPLDFARLKKCTKTISEVLQHKFFKVRLMKLTFWFNECFWIDNPILWWFLDIYASRWGPSVGETIRWVLSNTFPYKLSSKYLVKT